MEILVLTCSCHESRGCIYMFEITAISPKRHCNITPRNALVSETTTGDLGISSLNFSLKQTHYRDVIVGALASQITSLTIVYSTVYSDADQREHQSSTSLAFLRGIRR